MSFLWIVLAWRGGFSLDYLEYCWRMSDGNSGMHLWTIFIHDLSIRQILLLGCPLQFFFL